VELRVGYTATNMKSVVYIYCIYVHIIGFEVLTAVVPKNSIFWDIMLVSCLAYSSTLKIQAICSSEMSADFQRTTRNYIHVYLISC
jgi:hypothetical protein